MRKIHIITEYVPLFAGMLMLLSSCEHKDLCFDHDPHAPKSEVRIEAEYEKEWQYTYEGSTDWKTSPLGRNRSVWNTTRCVPEYRMACVCRCTTRTTRMRSSTSPPRGGRVYAAGGTLPAVLQQRHGIHRVRRDAVVRFGKGHHTNPYPFLLSR